MKAMILAAGRGERMRPLTDVTPKPLLQVGGKALIVWHLENLRAAGFTDIVINHAHLGAQIEETLGNGAAFGVNIAYSPEPPGALETAGGIRHALPLLGEAPFLVVNGDIWCDWPFAHAAAAGLAGIPSGHPTGVPFSRKKNGVTPLNAAADPLAHLVLVNNPPHNARGDFALDAGRILNDATPTAPRLTFSGIGIYSPLLFEALPDHTPAKLAPLLRAAADAGRLGGELHRGEWIDIGTPERLRELDAELARRART
jgi:MurNAc alpha-1-phosphate uridylyltransferase